MRLWLALEIEFVGERAREEQWKVKRGTRAIEKPLRLIPRRRRRGVEGTIEIEGREHREGIYT